MWVSTLSVVDSTVITMLGDEYRFCCLLLCSTFHFYFIMGTGYISVVRSVLWNSLGVDHFAAIDTASFTGVKVLLMFWLCPIEWKSFWLCNSLERALLLYVMGGMFVSENCRRPQTTETAGDEQQRPWEREGAWGSWAWTRKGQRTGSCWEFK